MNGARGAARPDATLAGQLSRTLILWVGALWLVATLAVVWFVDHEINENFDSELVEVSHRLFDSVVQEYDQRRGGTVHGGTVPSEPLTAPTPLFPSDEVRYRLLDAAGHVLMRSHDTRAGAFEVPLAPGFADAGDWRNYTVHHPQRPLYLQVADPLDERRETLDHTLFGLIVPLVAVLPLLAWLLHNIARRELRVLKDMEAQIAQRSGTDLRPIALADLPRELRSVGDQFNHLLERLSQALDVERALAANAAHELRTPLAAARLRLEAALEQDLRREDVLAALTSLKTLANRAEKLLQLSRAESGAALARAPVSLLQLAAGVAQEFWDDERVRERLDLKVPETDVKNVTGDFDALAIALRNLVENALKYGAGSRVLLQVTPKGELVVRDHGPGVPAGQLDSLRQRHVRQGAHAAGYGLGLSIVASIAQRHDARLRLASPPPGAAQGFEARIVFAADPSR